MRRTGTERARRDFVFLDRLTLPRLQFIVCKSGSGANVANRFRPCQRAGLCRATLAPSAINAARTSCGIPLTALRQVVGSLRPGSAAPAASAFFDEPIAKALVVQVQRIYRLRTERQS